MKTQIFLEHLNTLLNIQHYKDYGPNGLQVSGKNIIKKVAFSVSASLEAIQAACLWQADALIVHHGILWDHTNVSCIDGPLKEKIRLLLENHVNLFAYHLPLDGHPTLGNAAQLAKSLEAQKIIPFGDYKGAKIGVQATFKKSITITQLMTKLEKILNRSLYLAQADQKIIKTFSIVTGSGASYYQEAFKSGIDAHITGEMSEYHWHGAKELGIHLLAGGHHATERFGVLALSRYILKNFKCDVQFFDSVNPI